jgi:hypothetical protein
MTLCNISLLVNIKLTVVTQNALCFLPFHKLFQKLQQCIHCKASIYSTNTRSVKPVWKQHEHLRDTKTYLTSNQQKIAMEFEFFT